MEKLGRLERHNRKVASVASNDWERIRKSHNEEAQALVDSYAHLGQRTVPESYLAMLSSDEYQTPSQAAGPKMLHDVADEGETYRMMTKPYYQGIRPATPHWVQHPIHGWATMASKAIFDAAGLEEMSEDVYAYSHQGIPITVHKFVPGYDTILTAKNESKQWDAPMQRSADPLQVQQIAIMDFLMGNLDRHDLNLLISDTKNEDGFYPLLALDHDNNFQYIKHLNEVYTTDLETRNYDSPADYINKSALRTAREAAPATSDPLKLKDWWVTHAEDIKRSFEEQVQFIKDPHIKDHVQKNFDRRFSMVQLWTKPGEEHGFENRGFFSEEFPSVVRNIPKATTASNVIEKILNVLPKAKPANAIKMLASALNSKRSPALKQKLSDTFDALIKQMSPEQLIELYDTHRKDYSVVNRNRSLGNHILEQVASTGDKTMAKALLDYDQGRGKLPLFWPSKLKKIAGIKEETDEPTS